MEKQFINSEAQDEQTGGQKSQHPGGKRSMKRIEHKKRRKAVNQALHDLINDPDADLDDELFTRKEKLK